MKTNTLIIIIAVVLIIIAGLIVGLRSTSDRQMQAHLQSFEDCSNAGFPISATYPEQCKAPDGRIFTRLVEPPQSSATTSVQAATTTQIASSTASAKITGGSAIHATSTLSNEATSTLPVCQPGGCSGEICSDSEVVSSCVYASAYACYKEPGVKCERQPSGQCGWTETPALQACLQAGGPAPAQ